MSIPFKFGGIIRDEKKDRFHGIVVFKGKDIAFHAIDERNAKEGWKQIHRLYEEFKRKEEEKR